MLYSLFVYLSESLHMKVPAVFGYYSTRMILAALTSLLISIFAGPFFIRKLYEMKIGQTIRTDECPLLGELHAKKQDTPTMGGILIIFSMLFSLVLWMDPTNVFTLILAFTTLFLGVVGGRDDYLKLKHKNTKGLSAKKKFLSQAFLSLVLACYLIFPSVSGFFENGEWFQAPTVKVENVQVPLSDYASRLYIPFVKEPIVVFSGVSLIFLALFYLCVITGTSNAVNLTDGLDGLAAGCMMMVVTALALIAFFSNHITLANYLNIAYIEGSGEIAIYLSAFAGACLGFLWYNGFPAQVFMGDIGSLTLGGIIGVSAVLLKREFLLLIIGGIFVAEALSVILQVASYKLRNQKRIFLCAPLHHHFEYKGWPETKVVLRFWIIGFLLAIVGVASLKFQ